MWRDNRQQVACSNCFHAWNLLESERKEQGWRWFLTVRVRESEESETSTAELRSEGQLVWAEMFNAYVPDRDLYTIREAFRLLFDARKLDSTSGALKDTPQRFIKAFFEMTSGYAEQAKDILGTVFDCQSDELVIVKDVSFVSLCEHHLMPFSGVAHLGYIPKGSKVVGLSKLARLVDCFAKRLQLQERLTVEIASAINDYLQPAGVGVVIEASHACMSCRGVMKADARMVTSSMLGCLRDEQEARAEFLSLIKR
jgi:GTP cyclohydrolase I